MRQLALFSETERALQEENLWLRAELARVDDERTDSWMRVRRLKDDVTRLKAELDLVRRTGRQPPATPALEPTLKKLLALAHPDRWSQGQLASELAHELAVTINKLRQEGQA